MGHLTPVGRVERGLQRPAVPRLGKVLVVNDDASPRSAVIDYLAEHRCFAIGARCADVGVHLQRSLFSLVVADMRGAPSDGIELLRQIRDRSHVPTILLADRRLGDLDRILALEMGADEVLGEPLILRELLARAHAILRRQELGRRATAPSFRGGYRFAGWELDHGRRAVRNPAGDTVAFSKGEYALLLAFLEAPRRILTRLQLMRATRAHEDVSDRSLDVQVMRLRRRIEADPARPRLIRTRRGEGYLFDAAVETVC